ncbi:MAG: response regulator [Bacteroidales bacterium]|nr:response regulator [Bacteroidales bacterium]
MTKKANILIVDDKQANIDVLEQFLERQGYTNFKSISDSRLVIDLFESFKPDLILLDLMMPHLSGFQVIEQLKTVIPQNTYLPVLVLTADVTTEAKQRALAAGAKDFLSKPFDLTEVGLRIKNLIETRFLHQQLNNQNQILEEKVKERTLELENANKELAFQNDEKEKRAAELTIANKELTFQNDEKEKRAAELTIANKELAFQNDEKEKRAAELTIANKELAFQNDEKEKRAAELTIANKELAFQNKQKEKRAEELVAAKEHAEESDKLKTAFINNISHEIRTPLNGILGFGSLLSQTDPSPEDKEEMLAFMQQSGNRLTNTITDYMDMAQIVSGTMEVKRKEFLLQPFFEEAIEETKQLCADKKIGFEADYQNNVELTLDSDLALIKRILNILLDNALKFTTKGSISCGYKVKDEFIEFFVADTGKGIAPGKLDVIFNMFTQEDSSYTRAHEGSGLGLTIARGVVKLLGGTISATSEPGIGSTFAFTVPYKEEPLEEKAPAEEEKNAAVDGKPLVLVAEDKESNAMYLKAVMKNAGFEYLLAKNGKEAVALCKQRPDITLVLMDIKMPVMGGLEATKHIREFRPELPIIATTAHAQTGDEQRFLAAGCDGYLAKPIKREKLLALFQKYVK